MLEKWKGEKRKQYIAIGITIILGVLGLVLLQNIMAPKKEEKKVEMPKIKIVDEKKVEEEPFKKVYGRELSTLQKQIEEMQKQIQTLNKMIQEEKQNQDLIIEPDYIEEPQTNREEQTQQLNRQQNIYNQPLYQQAPAQPQSQQKQKKVILISDAIALEVSNEVPNNNTTPQTEIEENKKKKENKNIKNTIPAGSFVKAVLLSGLDAPTAGSAIKSPHPVLLKLTDKAILPNKWKVNIKDCFIIGSGYGDLSSERAYIRLERLSCTKNDGTIISKTIEGYVSGEDGKIGLKGRVVSKQGQLLARTLLAGFLEGVSKAFSYSQQTLLVSPQGATSTINPNNAFQYAGLSGISEATKKLADFYMNLVNKTFPVIEILPGRKVDIVFLKDVKLED